MIRKVLNTAQEGKGRGMEEVKGIYVATASLFLSITKKLNDHPPTQHMAIADGDNWYTNSTSLSSLVPTANNVQSGSVSWEL